MKRLVRPPPIYEMRLLSTTTRRSGILFKSKRDSIPAPFVSAWRTIPIRSSSEYSRCLLRAVLIDTFSDGVERLTIVLSPFITDRRRSRLTTDVDSLSLISRCGTRLYSVSLVIPTPKEGFR